MSIALYYYQPSLLSQVDDVETITREHCQRLDTLDPVAAFREEFLIPEGLIYLDGNSLGMMPASAPARVREIVEQEWGQQLITSWNRAGWFELPYRLGDKIGELISAEPGEVAVTDGTGINLYKVLAAALALRPDRNVIIMEGSSFPTDNYIAQGLIQQLGGNYQLRLVEATEIEQAIGDDVAVVCLTQVHYKTGQLWNMAELTQKTQAAGAIAVWDLCHSAGALEVELNACNVDFAVGCTYKYLNGGPGSPAYVFMAKRHQGQVQQPLTGWWSHADPFAFEADYRPASNISQMMSGTQPIISLAMIEPGLSMFERVDMSALRKKSQLLSQCFIDLVEQRCADFEFTLVSPRDPEQRGSQVSFAHPHGYAIMQALIAVGVVGDFRAPDIIRFGLAPLYIRHEDIWNAVEALYEILDSEAWRKPEFNQRVPVT